MRSFDKILIANRGEIAVRVIRTCRERGYATVAVFSEVDRAAPHVQMADEAYPIGPPPSHASYLAQDKILAVARQSGAGAIHPGYGFLSENADFAERCAEAGITFIGPPPGAIRAMGDKTHARSLMQVAGVPMAPGTTDAVEDADTGARTAEEIGYPVLLKAAAGGGGKGMRIVEQPGDFRGAMEAAQREAQSAFGDGRVFIEKYIQEPRHIEFQVLADTHGHTVHLFERECSIQRRHQKVIEEAPSSLLTPEVRRRMGQAAVQAAQACGYVNAGTVEFLVDSDLNFYFMEMNTRLQVEHPVTEWITGIDLVAEQLRIAAGEPLGYRQEELSMRGHAIESRIYAEDPASNFLPDAGTLERHLPPDGFGVRVDAGVGPRGEVPIHYDPMIAKLTTWGQTRATAIQRMERALSEYDVAGVETTIRFCRFVMQHEAFRSGRFSTHFVDEHFDPDALSPKDEVADRAAALAAVLVTAQERHVASTGDAAAPPSGESRWARRRWGS